MIKVSTIIPFFKHIKWLEEAIDSVFSQTYQNIEIIVINDGSLEDDSSIISKYGRYINYIKTSNLGPGIARNTGIKEATGKYIAFLDSDDIWLSRKIENQVHLMERSHAIWSHTSYYRFFENKNREEHLIDVSSFYGLIYPRCLIRSPIATPCVMIKRDFLMENPTIRFAENMRYGQDSFMWLNMALNAPLEVISEPLVKIRIRGANAGFRARVKLQVRSQTMFHLMSESDRKKALERFPYLLRWVNKYCSLANNMVKRLESLHIGSDRAIEFISKILYIPAYILLRILSLKYS